MEEKQETVLDRIKNRVLSIADSDIAGQLLSLDEEAELAEQYLRRIRGGYSDSPTKADKCLDEIEFYIANDMIRHLCAVAADFYDRLGTVGWEPVGFRIGGGNYREITIRFRKYCVETRSKREYFGVLSRRIDRGEKYELRIDENPDGLRSCRAIFDILNTLAVPRSYIDGLFDMIEYSNEPLEQKYEKIQNCFIQLQTAVRNLNYELRDRSKKLQALKRPKKWRRKFAPAKLNSSPHNLPPPPTNTTSLVQAQIEYVGCAGIYFLWDREGCCAYVGKSKNIGQRLSSHEKTADHVVSVLLFDPVDIHFTELYYIWSLRPYLNKEGMETARELEKTNKNTDTILVEV